MATTNVRMTREDGIALCNLAARSGVEEWGSSRTLVAAHSGAERPSKVTRARQAGYFQAQTSTPSTASADEDGFAKTPTTPASRCTRRRVALAVAGLAVLGAMAALVVFVDFAPVGDLFHHTAIPDRSLMRLTAVDKVSNDSRAIGWVYKTSRPAPDGSGKSQLVITAQMFMPAAANAFTRVATMHDGRAYYTDVSIPFSPDTGTLSTELAEAAFGAAFTCLDARRIPSVVDLEHGTQPDTLVQLGAHDREAMLQLVGGGGCGATLSDTFVVVDTREDPWLRWTGVVGATPFVLCVKQDRSEMNLVTKEFVAYGDLELDADKPTLLVTPQASTACPQLQVTAEARRLDSGGDETPCACTRRLDQATMEANAEQLLADYGTSWSNLNAARQAPNNKDSQQWHSFEKSFTTAGKPYSTFETEVIESDKMLNTRRRRWTSQKCGDVCDFYWGPKTDKCGCGDKYQTFYDKLTAFIYDHAYPDCPANYACASRRRRLGDVWRATESDPKQRPQRRRLKGNGAQKVSCLFIAGAGAVNFARIEQKKKGNKTTYYRKADKSVYWRVKHMKLDKRCHRIKFLHPDFSIGLLGSGIARQEAREQVCDFLDRHQQKSTATHIFAHGAGNLRLADALQSGQCSLRPTTTWTEVQSGEVLSRTAAWGTTWCDELNANGMLTGSGAKLLPDADIGFCDVRGVAPPSTIPLCKTKLVKNAQPDELTITQCDSDQDTVFDEQGMRRDGANQNITARQVWRDMLDPNVVQEGLATYVRSNVDAAFCTVDPHNIPSKGYFARVRRAAPPSTGDYPEVTWSNCWVTAPELPPERMLNMYTSFYGATCRYGDFWYSAEAIQRSEKICGAYRNLIDTFNES